MSKQKKDYIPQIVKQILLAYLDKKASHYEEFNEFYKDHKEIFEFLKINKTEAGDFWFEVTEPLK